ncbi:sensor histidine kinase [Prauserella marina]|uniref:sensor histidine kinase n=1 Tax=Prauserella marina TaxID=530584 RepID=UPI00147604ED|nr:histidine kinase [Prauserella marina]
MPRPDHGEPAQLAPLRRYCRDIALGSVAVVGVLLISTIPGGLDSPVGTGFVLLLAAALTLHTRRILSALREPAQAQPLGVAVIPALVAIAATCVAVYFDEGNVLWSLLVGAVTTQVLIGRPVVEGRRLAVGIGMITVLAVGGTALFAAHLEGWAVVRLALGAGAVAVVFGYAESSNIRQWALTLELERARKAAGELATARERLRLAGDLHDILGHALEVVALKSELATRLSTADPRRSAAEMAEVHTLARTALRDVRDLVHGRRTTHLAAELTSAKTLLSSAGIGCAFPAETPELDDRTSELLGRVLREAVTNLLRHASPSACTVLLNCDVDGTALMVTNDGAAPMARAEGTGLARLSRRLEHAGGRLETEMDSDEGVFAVRARVPR